MRLLTIFLLACSAWGQATPSTPPANWYGAGGSWNGQAAGWASYAHLLSSSQQIYSFTTWDITRTKANPYVTSSARTGLAMVFRTIGPVTILGLTTAGVATSSTSTSGSFSGGGLGVIKIANTSWTVLLGARVDKSSATQTGSQMVYEIGMGRTW